MDVTKMGSVELTKLYQLIGDEMDKRRCQCYLGTYLKCHRTDVHTVHEAYHEATDLKKSGHARQVVVKWEM